MENSALLKLKSIVEIYCSSEWGMRVIPTEGITSIKELISISRIDSIRLPWNQLMIYEYLNMQ